MRIKRHQAIAALLAFLAAVPIIYAFTFVSVPRVTIPVEVYENINYWAGAGFPVVNLIAQYAFSAEGSLYVTNPTHVHAEFRNITIANFSLYYNRLSFTNAYNLTQYERNPNMVPATAQIPIHQNATGQYVADGDFIWLREGSTWEYFLPNTTNSLTVNYPDVEVGEALFSVTSVTDKLIVQSNLVTEQLTLVLVGLSFLVLQPILEAVFNIGYDDSSKVNIRKTTISQSDDKPTSN